MSAARRSWAREPKVPARLIDVVLMPGIANRMAAIKAVASGALPVEAVSINLHAVKSWALDVNQPEGEIHGFKITQRRKEDGEAQGKESGD